MTKREFYQRFRDEGEDVTLSDLRSFINEEELYEDIEILDAYSFTEWAWNQIHDWYGGLEDLKDWLATLEFTDWYVKYDYDDPEPIGEYEASRILDDIEEIMERFDDWLDELPGDDEEDDTKSLELSIAELI